MQHNLELVKTVRDVIGEEADLVADAHMVWTLDFARRMVPLPAETIVPSDWER